MKRKLQLLNVVLLALLVVLGFRFRQVWREARDREQATLRQTVPPQKAVLPPALPAYAPVAGTSYMDVAQKLLFARDRNPNVIIDPVQPPAPKPMPALPYFHGIMSFGKPGIILSEKGGAPQKTYRPGDKIGEFTLVAFDRAHAEFEWDGKKIDKPLEELVDKSAPAAANIQNVPSASAGGQQAATVNVSPTPQGPGVDIGGGYKGCVANDSTPTGTVKDGLRKIEIATPFGKSCRWEPVK